MKLDELKEEEEEEEEEKKSPADLGSLAQGKQLLHSFYKVIDQDFEQFKGTIQGIFNLGATSLTKEEGTPDVPMDTQVTYNREDEEEEEEEEEESEEDEHEIKRDQDAAVAPPPPPLLLPLLHRCQQVRAASISESAHPTRVPSFADLLANPSIQVSKGGSRRQRVKPYHTKKSREAKGTL